MKLLRRNKLDTSKQIGLWAFATAILLIAFFFNHSNKNKKPETVKQVVEANSSIKL